MTRLVVVSNRVPDLRAQQPNAGGLAVALRGALDEHGGLWFGWDGHISEAAVSHPQVETQEGIEFATLPLSREDHDQYYLGYSNEVLWPLCHFNLGAMQYRRRNAEGYLRVNRLFADALAPLLKGDEVVWVHDYHLIPLGQALRRRNVQQRLGYFLHIPFPSIRWASTSTSCRISPPGLSSPPGCSAWCADWIRGIWW